MAERLDGKLVSQYVQDELNAQVSDLVANNDIAPGLAVILVGDDPASKVYVANKQKACERIGIKSFEYILPSSASQDEIAQLIQRLNDDRNVHGILLQLPLPKGLDSDALLRLIDSRKDVDGFHPENIGQLLLGLPSLKSCTPFGVMKILEHYNISTKGKHAVIIGRSNIVGKPLAAMLMQRGADATVTVCHSKTENMSAITSQADILIAAIGQPEFVTADMVKEGAVVIDVGINRVDDSSKERGFRLVGDVSFDEVSAKASSITPVPGGVGPMTIAMLMTNTIHAYLDQVG
jgi:methylenetetrahydrofolate dehydrogenase (NADP+)/methenyltetrahydrofolate cyclohydrolase